MKVPYGAVLVNFQAATTQNLNPPQAPILGDGASTVRDGLLWCFCLV